MARTTRPGITIAADGRWFFRENEIFQEGVLTYFKQNLRQDGDGYYIINRFGELLEHGYLDRVEGFPLFITAAYPEADPDDPGGVRLRLVLDSGETLRVPGNSLRIYGDDLLAVIIPERDVPARLTGPAMASLVEYLHVDDNDEYFLVLPDEQRKVHLEHGDATKLF